MTHQVKENRTKYRGRRDLSRKLNAFGIRGFNEHLKSQRSGRTVQIIYFSMRRKYLENSPMRRTLPRTIQTVQHRQPTNQPTDPGNHPLEKKKREREKIWNTGKLPRTNGNRLNSHESLGDSGIWHSAFGKWKLNEIRSENCCSSMRECLSFSLPTDNVLQSDTCRPTPSRARRLRALPSPPLSAPPSTLCTRNPLVSSHFWHRLHFRWNNRPEAFSISITASRAPRATSVTNQQRHSRVIGFYVMLSSRELRAIRFPSGWAHDIPIKALDLELIKYQLLLDRPLLFFFLSFFFFFHSFFTRPSLIPAWYQRGWWPLFKRRERRRDGTKVGENRIFEKLFRCCACSGRMEFLLAGRERNKRLK